MSYLQLGLHKLHFHRKNGKEQTHAYTGTPYAHTLTHVHAEKVVNTLGATFCSWKMIKTARKYAFLMP